MEAIRWNAGERKREKWKSWNVDAASKIAGPLERDRRASNSFHAAANGRLFAAIRWRGRRAETVGRLVEKTGETETGITNKGRCTRTRYKGISSLSPVSLLFYQLPRRDHSGQKDNAISLCCANISLYSWPYCATGVPISWKESKLEGEGGGRQLASPRITTKQRCLKKLYYYSKYTRKEKKKEKRWTNNISIALFPTSSVIIYHLTGITHREERKGRESFVREGRFWGGRSTWQ